MHRRGAPSLSADEPRPRPRSIIGSRRDVPDFIPRPKGLHKLSYQRLLRAMHRVLHELDRLPARQIHPLVRRRLQTQLENQLGRMRRRLGLPVERPRAKTWHRTGESAALIGISSKTLLRWVAAGRVQCERADSYKRPRYFHRRELLRVIASLTV
jgi:hypothetical protein